MAIVITRKQLYERVWQQSITHIAKDLGLSDVGLRKVCKRHSIPTPRMGHWMKVAHGKRVTVVELPEPDDDRVIQIWRGMSGEEPEEIAKARADALNAVSETPKTGQGHAIVERTMAKLRGAKPGRDGLVRSKGAKLINVAVRPESLARAEQLLRQLVAAGEGAGLQLTPGEDAVAWESNGELVYFDLHEAADQVEHIATEKELAAHAKWERERLETHKRYGYWSSYGEPKIPKWEQQYNGRLAITLEKVRIKSEQDPWGRAIRGTFADSRNRDVARMIPSIVGAMAASAAAKRSNAAYQERKRIADDEARRRWQEEERRRYEWQRAGKVLDELIDIERKADAIERWLTRIRADGASGPRMEQFVKLVDAQLKGLRDSLGAEALEKRLEAARLFGEDKW